MGLEALSRGAAQAVFVDRDRRAAALVAKNAARCGAADRAVIVRTELPRGLARRELAGPFDVIVVDPPYRDPRIGAILFALAGRMKPDGLLVLERAADAGVPDLSGLVVLRTVTTGDTALDFLRPAADG